MHAVEVDDFWIDEYPITAAQFRRFVRETGYVTVAERPLDPADYPDADPELLVPGSVVFRKTTGPVPLNDATRGRAMVAPKRRMAPGHVRHRRRLSSAADVASGP